MTNKELTETREPIAFPPVGDSTESLNHSDRRRKGEVRGRESRNRSLNTKLTPSEFAAVEASARSNGSALGEWVRDVILRELRKPSSSDPCLAEIIGVRLLLVNVLRPLAVGQQLAPEAFDKLLDEISEAKHQVAAKLGRRLEEHRQ
jgi:hypothetical protein